ESVSTLVPSAAVGGDIVRARLAAISGTPLPVAAGSVLVDITLGIFIQAGFTLLGLFLLVDRTGKTSFVGPTLVGVVVALFAFAVPAGLGVQEGGYLVVGNLLGIPGDGAFALSLVARAREIGLGVPGLITWQLIEARRLLRVRARLTANAR